jgi:hypothetical protein
MQFSDNPPPGVENTKYGVPPPCIHLGRRYGRLSLASKGNWRLKALIKSSRVNFALQVIQRMNDGMTVVDACQEVSLPRSTYYDTINKHTKAIAEFQEMMEANNRMYLGIILLNRNEMLQKLIAEGLSDETSHRDRLAIFKTLGDMADKLSETTQQENENEAMAREFMEQGPRLQQGVSRMAAAETDHVLDFEVLGGLDSIGHYCQGPIILILYLGYVSINIVQPHSSRN